MNIREFWSGLPTDVQWTYGVLAVLLAVAMVGCVVGWVQDRKNEREFYRRLYSDPEFRRQHHEIHKYDDWEDLGYFDGR